MPSLFSSISGYFPDTRRPELSRLLDESIPQRLRHPNYLSPEEERVRNQINELIKQNTLEVEVKQSKIVFTVKRPAPLPNNERALNDLRIQPTQPPNIDPIDKTADISKDILAGHPDGAPPIAPLPPYVSVIKEAYKGALAAIPMFLLALYTSKQELLQNVNFNIKATARPKVYDIALGSQYGREISLAFEVKAGKKIRFLHRRDYEHSTSKPGPIFDISNIFMVSMLGPLKNLIWKRQEHYTLCNIVIEDPGNRALKYGPLTTYIKATEREGFYLIQNDPNITPDTSVASDFVMQADASHWSSYKVLSVTVSDPISPHVEDAKQIIPLPFTEDSQHYVSITQIKA